MTAEPNRRYRRIAELQPMELIPLVGAGASLPQLREAADGLRNGFALERLTAGRWVVAGYTGTAERAQEWVDGPDDPDDGPHLEAALDRMMDAEIDRQLDDG